MAKLNIQMWMARFQRAKDLQKKEEKTRKSAIRLYTSTFFTNNASTETEDQEVNFVYEFIDVLLSAIYARNPHIFVTTENTKFLSFSDTMEKVINYYWREKKVKKKMKKAIKDALLQPPGWLSVGFKMPLDKETTQIELEQEFPELKQKKKTEEELGNLDETVKRGDISINYHSAWDVMWPDGYNDKRTSPYLFVLERTNLQDVQNNTMLKKSRFDVRRFIGLGGGTVQKPTSFVMSATPILNNQIMDGGTDLEIIPITLVHVWDRRDQQMFTLAEGFFDDTLFGPKEWEFLADGFPQFPLEFNEIPQTDEKANSYPMSDITPMMPQLKNLSQIDNLMMRHGKRQGGVVLYEEGGITEGQMSEIQNSNDLDAQKVDNIDKIKTFTFPTVPSAWFNLKSEVLNDLFRISGMKQLLASARGVDTATESENIREGGRIRQSGKIDVVEDFTVDIARFLSGTIWQFIDPKQIEEIISEPLSEEMWPQLPKLPDGSTDMEEAKRIVQKELFFRIDAGSTRPPKDEAVEQKLFTDSIQILKANFPNRFKEDILVEELLKKMKIPEAEKAVLKFDEEEIQAAQKENQLLAQGIPIPVSPNQNHILHIQVHAQLQNNITTPTTPQADQHISEHAAFMERSQGQSKQSNTPGQRKQSGVPEFADIVGSTKAREPGANLGGSINA